MLLLVVVLVLVLLLLLFFCSFYSFFVASYAESRLSQGNLNQPDDAVAVVGVADAVVADAVVGVLLFVLPLF
jgi:CBS domain containing-hemolysin-like protein